MTDNITHPGERVSRVVGKRFSRLLAKRRVIVRQRWVCGPPAYLALKNWCYVGKTAIEDSNSGKGTFQTPAICGLVQY